MPLSQLLSDSPFAGLGVMFVAGLVTSLTPCVYPMIPVVAGVLGGAGSAGRSRGETFGYTMAYALGLALVYAGLGLVAGLTGSLFGTISSNPWAYFAMGNLLLIFGLAMLDVFSVNVPSRVLAWASRFGGGSYSGALTMGATSGLVAAPCGAPAFAAALTFVTVTGSALLGFAYLFVFALGMTALLIVIGLAAGLGARLPGSGAWTLWIKRLAGVVLIGMAEYYFVQMGMVT